ncbi:MAG: hypothetical protein EA424_09770 [Planctomycetaceae bacterium]|nr:MAG: hypothetical protein EA424_09770 [Planctomycetaceae bacterium]
MHEPQERACLLRSVQSAKRITSPRRARPARITEAYTPTWALFCWAEPADFESAVGIGVLQGGQRYSASLEHLGWADSR